MKKLTYIFAAILIVSCSSDNNPAPEAIAIPGDTNTEFVIGTNAYVTPKAYLLIDDAAGDYEREFTFVFSDGDIIEDASNEIAFETTTTNYSKITCNLISTVVNEADIPIFVWPNQNSPVNIIMEGNNFSEYGISSYMNTYSSGGQTFGQVDASTLFNHTGQAGGNISHPTHLFTVNSLTFDLTAKTGTIDCTYNYEDDNNVLITGVFVGNFEILTAF